MRHLAVNVRPLRRLSVQTLTEHPRIKAFGVFDAVRWTQALWPASFRLGVRVTWFEIGPADTYKD
jgi:hypothetical protein